MKTLAGILLGAAAAYGAYKYFTMTDEEKQKTTDALKRRASKLKQQAMDAEKQAMDYFNDLKEQGKKAYDEYAPKAEEYVKRTFHGSKEPTNGKASYS